MIPALTVDRSELIPVLKSIGKIVKRSETGEAVLYREDDMLKIALPGVEVGVAAEGHWPGRARIPAQFLLVLARVPPDGDPVHFRVEKGRLRINSSATACVWKEDTDSPIELPLNPPFTMLLSVAYHYTPDDILRAGLQDNVASAEQRRDTLIGQALAILSEFGVTHAELRTLVDEKMRRMPKP
jgi:hypothetical protein